MKLQTKFTFLIFSCVGILCAAFIWASFRLADTYNEMIYKRTADALTFSAENLASLFQTNAELSRQIATNETIQQALVTARSAGSRPDTVIIIDILSASTWITGEPAA